MTTDNLFSLPKNPEFGSLSHVWGSKAKKNLGEFGFHEISDSRTNKISAIQNA